MPEVNFLATHYIEHFPRLAAEALEQCSIDDRLNFLGKLDPKLCSIFLTHLPPYLVVAFFGSIDNQTCCSILRQMDSKLSAAFLRKTPEARRQAIIEQFPESERTHLASGLSYLPDTAGFYMDASIQTLKSGTKIDEAIQVFRSDANFVDYVYVVDEEDKLIGVTTIRRVLQQPDGGSAIDDLMEKTVVCLFVDDEKQDIVDHKHWHRFSTLPVVDYSNRYLGALRYKQLVKLRGSATTDDKMRDLDEVNQALTELYGIGFAALIGSSSYLIPPKEDI